MSNGKVFILVGKRKTGKTTYAANVAKKLKHRKHIFYFHGKLWDSIPNRTKYESKDTLLNYAQECKNSCIIFEDATAYIRQQGTDERMLRCLTGSREKNNVVMLIFHSLRKIPLDIFELSDYIFLFDTNDQLSKVVEKFEDYPEVIAAFNKPKIPYKPVMIETGV